MWGYVRGQHTLTTKNMIATTRELLSEEIKSQVEEINLYLKRNYGYFNEEPTWRVVWSDDQREMRKGTFNYFDKSTGAFLRTEVGVHEVPKYDWIKEKYVLERIMPVPEINRDELTSKLSYEPVFTFDNDAGQALIPRLDVCQLVIEAICKEAAKHMGVKYKDPYADPKIAPEVHKAHIDNLTKELFGNETAVGDALHYKDGVVIDKTDMKLDDKTIIH